MKRCRLTYDEWSCMTSKSRVGGQVELPALSGYLGLLTIHSVSKKQIWHYGGREVVVCDSGYHWLTVMPRNAFYCMTVMMDESYQIKVCYIDMIDSQGIDADGVPYFYDLYLDLVFYPDGTVIVDDMDELQRALETGEITGPQYDRALAAARKLQRGLLSDPEAFKGFVDGLLQALR